MGYDDNNRVKKEINKQFPFSRIEKTEVHLKRNRKQSFKIFIKFTQSWNDTTCQWDDLCE